MARAFAYLTICSIRNAVRLRLQRLRQVRYLLVALGLIVYAASLLWSRSPGGIVAIPPAYRQEAELAAVIIATVLLGAAWVLPSSLALQFTSAEVHLLFPAPLTRRQLIGYKLSRLLLGAGGTSLLLTLFIGPTRALPAAGFAGRTFVVLAVLTLYQTGVSLHRRRSEDGVRLRGQGRFAMAAPALLVTPVAGWVLARVALAPVGELAYVWPLAAALVVAGGLWVLHSDAAFEEAAAESAEKVQLAARHGAPPRLRARRGTRFRLAPEGRIEPAILWKNWPLITRPSPGGIVTITVLLVSLFLAVWIVADLARGRSLAGILSFVAAGGLVLLGPTMLRVDLRQDLAHLAIIKTWPVRGAAVFRGELLAPLIALSLGATLPILLASALDDKVVFGAGATAAQRAVFAVSALPVAGTLTLAQLVIQNGIAVTFPAWVRLSPAGGVGAMEMIGQTMVTLYGGLFALMLALIVPAGAAAAAWFVVRGGSLLTPLAVSVVFCVMLVLECALATELFGRILDRADLQDPAVAG